MGKTKINSRFERNENIGDSDIYRKFSEQFDNLFNSEEVAKTDGEFKKTYVHDYDFESQLENFRNSRSSMAKFCVGYTGIGKSTTIRYVFGLGINNTSRLDEGKREIIFPTFLDGYNMLDIKSFDISKRIAALCTKLENKYPELRQYMKTFEGKKEFHDFIEKHTGFILENVNPIHASRMSDEDLIIERLDGAYKKNEYEYQANRLKFYIMKNYDKYERLIIILDDIETLPVEYQKETICKFLKLYSCMKNTDYTEGYSYNINLLISIRPHTHRFFNDNRRIEAFPISDPAILKKDSVDLENIFVNRFDYYTSIVKKEIGNINTWNECKKVLMEINNQFEGQYKKMIKNLCFMNVREALASYSRVFANRYWVQKNMPKQEAFTISSPDYVFNNINVIRALACNEESVFWGDNSSIIPNVFLTSEETDLSIYCLLVMKYFYKSTTGLSYGLNTKEISSVKNIWKEIFASEDENDDLENMDRSMSFLFENKILRKSIIDFEDKRTFDSADSLNGNSHLYISPRGSELYKMFTNDSVFLEMLREANWRDYRNRDYSMESSSELMKKSQQATIFIDLLDYIEYLCEEEERIRVSIKNKKKYIMAFGSEPVVQNLLIGVKNSLDYSGIVFSEKVYKKYTYVKNRIQDVSNMF